MVGMAAQVAVPVMLGRGIDAVADGDSPTPFVIALVVLAVVRFTFGFTYRFGLFRSALRIENDLRNLMYERLTALSFDFWDRTQSGQVISRANTDIRSIQLLFAFGPLVAMQVVMFLFAIVVMVAIDLPLTLVAIAPLPFVYMVGMRLRNRIFPLQWVVTARQAELATIVDENIQGIRVVKAFNQEANQVQHLARSARRLRWAGTAVVDTRARHSPGMESLPRLGLALVLLYGGLQAIEGDIAIGDLVAFSTYVVMLATPFRMLG
ncbi:MAG: ABC transporter ATP-binding protein, partial [Nitrospinae bacterium]|nr:ABC transporter ATP-binding protein [Nitrospinota bacterium]